MSEQILIDGGQGFIAPHAAGDATLITGGAGFIGSHLAHRLLLAGERVVLLDNLSSAQVTRNIDWLARLHGGRVALIAADIRDAAQVIAAVSSASTVFHFAAQPALVESFLDPARDFDVNARGTLNVLEALRTTPDPPPLVFASTSKVYGPLADLPLCRHGQRVSPEDEEIAMAGISEDRPIDLQSPHGCSKGAADQYVLDYARTFGIPATVLRMGTVYGPRQLGSASHGWVSHFMKSAMNGDPITIHGDGAQVRDLLFIDDLVDALILARIRMRALTGIAFNIGGGPRCAYSLLEILDLIEELEGPRPRIYFSPSRPCDQRYYASDCRRFSARTGWSPRVSVREGLARLHSWLRGAAREAALARALSAASQGAML